MKNVNERIGFRIKQMRELRGYTQSELAYMISEKDVNQKPSQSTISCWEHGTQPVPSDSFVALMECLECSPYALLGDMSPCIQSEQHLHRLIHHLSDHAKRILLYLLDEWLGDFLCLLEFAFLYACLPEKKRKVAARHCLKIFDNSRDELSIYANDVDVDKIYDGLKRLNKGPAAKERENDRRKMEYENKKRRDEKI